MLLTCKISPMGSTVSPFIVLSFPWVATGIWLLSRSSYNSKLIFISASITSTTVISGAEALHRFLFTCDQAKGIQNEPAVKACGASEWILS